MVCFDCLSLNYLRVKGNININKSYLHRPTDIATYYSTFIKAQEKQE